MVTKTQLNAALESDSLIHTRHNISLTSFASYAIQNPKYVPVEAPKKFPVVTKQPKFMVNCGGTEIAVVWEYDVMLFDCEDGVAAYRVDGKQLF